MGTPPFGKIEALDLRPDVIPLPEKLPPAQKVLWSRTA